MIPMFTLTEYRKITVAMRQQKYCEKHLGVGLARGQAAPYERVTKNRIGIIGVI